MTNSLIRVETGDGKKIQSIGVEDLEATKVNSVVFSLFDTISRLYNKLITSSLFTRKDEETEVATRSQLDGSRESSALEKIWNHDKAESFETSHCAGWLSTLFNDSELTYVHRMAPLSFDRVLECIAPLLPKEKRGPLDQLQETSKELAALREEASHLLKNENKANLLAKAAARIADKVQHLQDGKSYYLEGVWKEKKEGLHKHAVYQFSKGQKEGTYNLRVYDVNPEAVEYQSSFSEAGKNRVFPVLEFADIKEEDLFFNHDGVVRPDFFQALIEPNVLGISCSSDFIFKKVLGHLYRYNVQPNQDVSGFMLAMPKETTPWNAVAALLLTHLGRKDHKAFVFQTRYDALLARLRLPQGGFGRGHDQWRTEEASSGAMCQPVKN